jgi:predicted DNA-binding transcriptional regulator YafY
VWTLAAWCELRRDYRSFRVDRFVELVRHIESIPDDTSISLRDFIARAGREDCPPEHAVAR